MIDIILVHRSLWHLWKWEQNILPFHRWKKKSGSFKQIHVWESILEPRAWVFNSCHQFLSFIKCYGFLSIFPHQPPQSVVGNVTHHDFMAVRGAVILLEARDSSVWAPRFLKINSLEWFNLTSSMVISPLGFQRQWFLAFSKALKGSAL